ncbi:hypothetical protein [Ruminococcus sp.]|uniref:hypothetical protein n=1 Tax=Ruminococcus sp. TaxID=41978 RepID=UPI003F0FA10F
MLFPSSSQRDWNKWKCPKPKFDPKTLKSFDKIIYRFDNSGKWRCDFFSHMLTEKTLSVISTYYPIDFCIPYNDDTKHLVGTSDEAPEYYRYWED